MGSKTNMMSCISNEQEESRERAILININKKSDNDQNLMLDVYLLMKTNSLTGKNISIFTVFFLFAFPFKTLSFFNTHFFVNKKIWSFTHLQNHSWRATCHSVCPKFLWQSKPCCDDLLSLSLPRLALELLKKYFSQL